MYKLFDPQIKVQKNRDVLRATDMRMAKYSRRGLIANLLVYFLCLVVGDLYWSSKLLAISLTVGLIVFTLLRAYFLFRFEAIYPRGPAKWRNYYFMVTLLGALWWGIVLSCFIIVMELDQVALLLVIYTIVFFSTTAHAFAPFGRFLTLYQFLGIIPPAVVVMVGADLFSIFYGVLLVAFYLVLNHQSRLVSDVYWDKLEAEYDLKKQAEFLEEEKRDTQKSVQLSKEYMNLLSTELRGLLYAKRSDRYSSDRQENAVNDGEKAEMIQRRPKLELLYKNVSDFQQILSKEIKFEYRLFNVRNLIQDAVARHIDMLEGEKVDIASLISPGMPVRVLGDAERMNQVISILLRLVTTQSLPNSYVFVDVDFTRDKESDGMLVVNFTRQISKSKIKIFKDQNKRIELNLDLALAKAIIAQMGGALEIGAISKRGGCLRFQVSLGVPNNGGQPDYQKVEFKHKKLLVIHPEPRVLEAKQFELESLGFEVAVDKNYKNAMSYLEQELKEGHPLDAVVFYASSHDDMSLEFSAQMFGHSDLRFTRQLIIGTETIWQNSRWYEVADNPGITKLNKPTGHLEFEMSLRHIFLRDEEQVIPSIKNKVQGSNMSLLVYCREKHPLLKEQLRKLPFTSQVTHEEKHFVEVFERQLDSMLLICADSAGLYVDMINKLRENTKDLCIYPVIVLGDKGQAQMAYCNGADYFVELSLPNYYLKHVIEHWVDFYRLNVSV